MALVKRFARPGHNGHLAPEEALARVGLADAVGVYPHQLSGGMQQRLALARVLCQGAGVWLMDEPFAALDALTREHLAAELVSLWQPLQPTVLWVTHNVHEALRLADRVVVLSPRPGEVVLDLALNLDRPRREEAPAYQAYLGQLRQALGLAAALGGRMNASLSRSRSGLVAAAIVLIFFILWEGGVALSQMPPYLLPAPSRVLQTLAANSDLLRQRLSDHHG